MSAFPPSSSQSGNALVYILIAIALLSALSYAVSQSSRGSTQQLNSEKARVLGNEIVEYGTLITNAFAQLRLRGCALNQITFETPENPGQNINLTAPPDKTCNIFDLAGAGVTFRLFKSGTTTFTPNFGYGTMGIKEIGLNDQSDLWMRLSMGDSAEAHLICSEINKLMKLQVNDPATPAFEPFQDGSWGDSNYTGSFPASVSELDTGPLNGKTTFCAGHSGDLVSFWQLILAR